MDVKTPTPLKSEHQALRAEIERAARLPGRTGAAMRLVSRLTERHFAKEEALTFPSLGLLPALARDEIEADISAVLTQAEKLNEELPNLLAEQRAIVAALEQVLATAETDGHAELVGLAERLMLHEEFEERVSYPTAILIGKYLHLRLDN